MSRTKMMMLFSALMLSYCGGDSPATDATATTDASVPAPIEPKLSVIQQKVFSASCAFSTCHGADSPEQGMSLTAGNAFASLVGAKSADGIATRVVAGKRAESLLYQVLNGPVGKIAQMPKDSPALPATYIEAIGKWIDQGAQNN